MLMQLEYLTEHFTHHLPHSPLVCMIFLIQNATEKNRGNTVPPNSLLSSLVKAMEQSFFRTTLSGTEAALIHLTLWQKVKTL